MPLSHVGLMFGCTCAAASSVLEGLQQALLCMRDYVDHPFTAHETDKAHL